VTLAETQSLFHEAITSGRTVARDRLEACFVGTAPLPASERVAIYDNMYRWRLIDALRQTFPNVARYLGEERFAALAEEYVRTRPSAHHDISKVGRRLAGFLRAHPAPERSDLGDLAELEWTRQEVFFAPAAEGVSADLLASMEPEVFARTGLALAPAVRLLRLSHDVVPLWRCLEGSEPPAPPARGRSWIAVWRVGWDVVHSALGADEAEALRRARSGRALGEVCAAFGEGDRAAAAAHAALSSWLAEGWIVGISSPT
jgi:hypothetical protein